MEISILKIQLQLHAVEIFVERVELLLFSNLNWVDSKLLKEHPSLLVVIFQGWSKVRDINVYRFIDVNYFRTRKWKPRFFATEEVIGSSIYGRPVHVIPQERNSLGYVSNNCPYRCDK